MCLPSYSQGPVCPSEANLYGRCSIGQGLTPEDEEPLGVAEPLWKGDGLMRLTLPCATSAAQPSETFALQDVLASHE